MEQEVFDYLQSLLPQNIYYVNPYLYDVPLPNGDFVSFNISSSTTIGRSAPRELSHTEDNISIAWDVNKVYNIQIDFYGINSFDNAEKFQQILQVKLDLETEKENSKFNFKSVGNEIRNLTDLMEDKTYLKRYGFNVELFTIETITSDDILISGYELESLIIK